MTAGPWGRCFCTTRPATIADGDSLSYSLSPSRQVQGGIDAAKRNNNTPDSTTCVRFAYPQNVAPVGTQVPYPGVPAGQPGDRAIFKQDPLTGQITWNAPSKAGIYNIAFTVKEWRRTAGGFRQIGTVIRDMQIIVTATDNLPPVITVPPDVCVVAGTPVTLTVAATDGTAPGAQAPSLVYAICLQRHLAAGHVSSKTTTGTSVTGTFRWQTECKDVSDQPYVVVFKAQDSPPAGSNAPHPD